jgi:hypothetical protein
VLGHGRLRQSDFLDDVAADAVVVLEQQSNDLYARRVSERPCGGSQCIVSGVVGMRDGELNS